MRRTFNTVLVANRGEIARRILRTLRTQGYRSVAVYSEADVDALHVSEADQAICLGPAPASASYLNVSAVLAAAQQSGAEAIHPGYGFLSERADFAEAVIEAGLVFIGPSPSAIAAMGHKSEAKRRMLAAGVPCVPGYEGEDQRDQTLIAAALQIGLPVMIKAAAGGGGRGMRWVSEESELAAAIASARSEASSAFGVSDLLIEKAVVDARHVEIQVFGDHHGGVLHLGERDCSVQRRHQKLIEEAPSPAVNDALRDAMGRAAVQAAKAVDYVGAGTVEFLLAPDGAFYFLEMNTRLQVEHPVTEAVYDVDLVDWQLRVAQGEALPMDQQALLQRRHGWAIEVRLCAEDPVAGYLPQAGAVLEWAPGSGPGVRLDGALASGIAISPYYDSMQAKLIASGADREQARCRLLEALRQTAWFGVRHNKGLLTRLLEHPVFSGGHATTGFIGQLAVSQLLEADAERYAACAAWLLYRLDAEALAVRAGLSAEMLAWRSSSTGAVPLKLRARDKDFGLEVLPQHEGGDQVSTRERRWQFGAVSLDTSAGRAMLRVGDGTVDVRFRRDGHHLWLDMDDLVECYEDISLAPPKPPVPGSDGKLRAQTDGKVVAVLAQPGEEVSAGQTLIVVEAMKMEFQLSLPIGGRVGRISVAPGQQIRQKESLLELEAAD